MDYTEEQISLAFDNIPRSTQDVLFTSEIEEMAQSIGAPLLMTAERAENFNALVNMTILKLADEKEFAEKLVAQLKTDSTVAQKITSEVFSQIINPIRIKEEAEKQNEVLEEGREEEEDKKEEAMEDAIFSPTETPEVKKERTTAWKSGAAPDNLPIAETPEYLVPPIPSKATEESVDSAHPFEEKMKRVFTAGQQSMGDLTLAPIAPQTPNTAHAPYDPYRETIE